VKKLLIAVSVAALGLALPAYAGFISLNSPFDPGPTYAPLPGSMVEVSATRWGGVVAGYQPAAPGNIGQVSFGPMDLIGQLTSDFNYTTSGTESLSFNSTGNPGVIQALTATITWNSIFFPSDFSSSVPALRGTGIVISSNGDDAFKEDFPVDGRFDITADFLFTCDRFAPNCAPGQTQYNTDLLNGSLTPAVPSPIIGKGLAALLCLTLLGLVNVYSRHADRA
jgi:hypothetical protein